jgi:hypothetical protein
MNRRHNTIKFTYGIEQQKVLFGYWNKTKRGSDTNLDFNVYRKPTATERYMTIDAHHCIQHKSAAFNSMVNRLFTISMSAENQLKELKKIKLTAKTNGYSEECVDRVHKNTLRKTTYDTCTFNKKWRHPKSLLLKTNYKTSSKNTKLCWFLPTKEKLVILGNPKDKSEQLKKSGIYEIKSNGCNAVYVAQTRRSVSVRFSVNTSVISDRTIQIYQMWPVMSSNISEILIVITKSALTTCLLSKKY